MDNRAAAIVGLLLNSALYLSGCFVGGLVTHNGAAWRFALAATGFAYLGYAFQLAPARGFGVVGGIVGASVIFGAAAGIALLF